MTNILQRLGFSHSSGTSSESLNLLSMNTKKISGKSPFPRTAFSATESLDGKEILIFGGLSSDNIPTNDMHVLHLSGLCSYSEVTVIGSPPSPRCYHSAARIGKKIFYFGGLGSQGSRDDYLYIFSIDTNTWSRPRISGTVPVGRHGHTMTAVNNSLWMFGGITADGYSNELWVIDDVTAVSPRWRLVFSNGFSANVRAFHSASLFNTHQIIIFGGECGFETLNELLLFDTRSSTWTKVSDTGPSERYEHAYLNTGTNLLVFGGKNFEGNALDDVWSFEYKSDEWRLLGTIQQGRYQDTAFDIGSKVLLLGGSNDTAKDFPSAIILDLLKLKHKKGVITQNSSNYVEITSPTGLEEPPELPPPLAESSGSDEIRKSLILPPPPINSPPTGTSGYDAQLNKEVQKLITEKAELEKKNQDLLMELEKAVKLAAQKAHISSAMAQEEDNFRKLILSLFGSDDLVDGRPLLTSVGVILRRIKYEFDEATISINAMKGKLQNMKDENSSLRASLKEKDVISYSTDIQQNLNNEYTKELEQKSNEILKLSAELEKATEFAKLERNIAEKLLAKEIEAGNENERLENQLKELQILTATLDSENENLKTKLSELEESLKTEKIKQEDLLRQKLDLEGDLKKKDEVLEKRLSDEQKILMTKLKTAETMLSETSKKLSSNECMAEKSSIEFAILKSENEKLKSLFVKNSKDEQNFISQLQVTKDQLKKTSEDLEDCKKRLEISREENGKLKNDIRSQVQAMEKQLKTNLTDLEDRGKNLAALDDVNSDLKAQNEKLSAETESLRELLKKSSQESAAYQDKLKNLVKENEILQKDHDDVRSRLQSSEHQLKNSYNDLEEANSRILVFKEENEALKLKNPNNLETTLNEKEKLLLKTCDDLKKSEQKLEDLKLENEKIKNEFSQTSNELKALETKLKQNSEKFNNLTSSLEFLKKENEKLLSEMSTKISKEDFDKLKSMLGECQDKLLKLSEETKSYKMLLETTKKVSDSLKTDKNDISVQLMEKDRQIALLKKQEADYLVKLSSIQCALEESELEKKESVKASKNIEVKLNEVIAAFEKSQALLKESKLENEALKTTLAKSLPENEESELRKQLRLGQENLERYSKELTSYKTLSESLTKEFDIKSARIAEEFQKKISVLELELQKTISELDLAKKEINKFEKDNLNLRDAQKTQVPESEIKRLTSQLNSIQDELRSRESEFSTKVKHLEKAEGEILKLNDEIKSLKLSVSQSEEKLKNTSSEVCDIKQSRDQLKMENESLKKANNISSEFEKTKEDLQKRLNKISNENEELRALNESLKSDLKKIEAERTASNFNSTPFSHDSIPCAPTPPPMSVGPPPPPPPPPACAAPPPPPALGSTPLLGSDNGRKNLLADIQNGKKLKSAKVSNREKSSEPSQTSATAAPANPMSLMIAEMQKKKLKQSDSSKRKSVASDSPAISLDSELLKKLSARKS